MTSSKGFPRYPAPVRARDSAARRQSPAGRRLSAFRPRTVVFASPRPPAECARRLASRTAPAPARPFGYLAELVVDGPRSILIGDAGPYRVRVALRSEDQRRQPLVWFEGAISPARHGTTMVRGTLGPTSSVRVGRRVAATLAALTVGILTTVGLVKTITVGGSGPGPVTLAIAGVLTAFSLLAWGALAWSAQSQVERLALELSDAFGATNDPLHDGADGEPG